MVTKAPDTGLPAVSAILGYRINTITYIVSNDFIFQRLPITARQAL